MGWPLVVYVIAMIILTVASYMLTPKPKVEDVRPKGLGDFTFPTATEGRAIPILYGTINVQGPNVIWYGNLYNLEIKKDLGNGKKVIGHRYFVGMDMVLCYGPVDRIISLEIGEKEYPTVSMSNPMPLMPVLSGTVTTLLNDYFLGGTEKGGTVKGTLRFYSGDPNPTQSTYLQSQLGSDIPALVNIAHVVAESIEVGESPNIQPYVFKVSRFPNSLGLTSGNAIIDGDTGGGGDINDGDANLMEILYDLLTSDVYGLGISPARLDLPSFVSAGNTLADEGNGASLMIDSITSTVDIITEITRQADAVFYEDSSGKFSVKLVRDDYTPAALPLYDESNILSLDSFARQAWNGTTNHVNIAYRNRANRFQDSGAQSQDLSNVRTQGTEVRSDFNYPFVMHSTTAQMIAERELKTLSFPLAKIVFTAGREAASLRPGDVIRLSWPEYGISEMVVRVATLDMGTLESGSIKLTTVQDVFSISEHLYAPPDLTEWIAPSDVPVAFGSTEENLREFPRILGNLYPDIYLDPTEARSWHFIRRPATQPSTQDALIFVDENLTGNYKEGFGTANIVPVGLLDAEYPLSTSDIESSDLLILDNEDDLRDIVDETANQIGKGYNLVLLQGATQAEDEIVGFEEIVNNGDGTWTLRDVHRGLLDTVHRTHSIGTSVWFFTEGTSTSEQTFENLDQINVKHVARTASGVLSLADATPLSITFNQRALRPHHPADITVNSTRLPVVSNENTNLEVLWGHRHNDDIIVRDADDGDHSDGAADPNDDHLLRFLHGTTGALFLEIIGTWPGTNWHDYTYTLANLRLDSGEVGNIPLVITLHSIFDLGAPADLIGLESLQRATSPKFNVDTGSALEQSIDLNGTNEYLADTSEVALGFSDTFSISVWVRGTSEAGSDTAWIINFEAIGDASDRIRLQLFDDSDGSPFIILIYSDTTAKVKSYEFGSYLVNTWTLLTITHTGDTLTVYQDGIDVTSTANKTKDSTGYSMTDTGRRVQFGSNGTKFFEGYVFSPACWTTVLSAAEVLNIWQNNSLMNLRVDNGTYLSSNTMNHLWDFRKTTGLGQDFQNQASGAKRDIDANSANINATDLNTDLTPKRVVQSVDLDGTTEYLANATTAAMGFGDVFSIAAWVKGTSTAGGTRRVFIDLDSPVTDSDRIRLFLNDDSNGSPYSVRLYDPAGTLAKDYVFGSYTANTWTHIVATWNAGTLLVYQDGVVQTPTTPTDDPMTRADDAVDVLIGGQNAATPAASWEGPIFDVATWTTVLGASEITEIESQGSTMDLEKASGDYASQASMNHHWDFRNENNIGLDYPMSADGTDRDVMDDAVGISASDITSDVP